eukprot:9658328-Karenia_brevis.AAC.1
MVQEIVSWNGRVARPQFQEIEKVSSPKAGLAERPDPSSRSHEPSSLESSSLEVVEWQCLGARILGLSSPKVLEWPNGRT